jgi:hypothetical protein
VAVDETPRISLARDKAQVVIENWEQHKVYVALFEIGPAGLITQLYPGEGDDGSIARTPPFTMGQAPRPREYKQPKEPGTFMPPQGPYTLKLIASRSPLDLRAALTFTVSDTGELIRTRGGGSCKGGLACLIAGKSAPKTRGSGDLDIRWSTSTVNFTIEK